MMFLRLITIAIATISISSCWGDQPSYQVSLFVNLHPKGSPVHLCNGAIVQSRLVLTTASCVHYQFSSKSDILLLAPRMLQVVSGSNTEFTDELTVGVRDILVADNFNFTTGNNDLALLRLDKKLPLDTRSDMNWITLEDSEDFEGPCLANFYVRNSLSNSPNYIQSEELPLLDSEVCRNSSYFVEAREKDVCSQYLLPLGFNCQAIETLMLYNGDRGTGLVCENKLVGVLSTVLHVNDGGDQDCSDKPVNAFYTSLTPHLEWIYTIIGNEDIDMYEHNEYISSLPYAGENNSMEETEVPEPGLTSPLVGSVTINSTEPLLNIFSSGSSLASGKILTITLAICSFVYVK